MNKIKEHPILISIMIAEAIALCFAIFFCIGHQADSINYLISPIAGIFIIYPIVLTIINSLFLFVRSKSERWIEIENQFEAITLVLGILFSWIVLIFYEIGFTADWMEVLYNNQVHTPIWTEGYLTVTILLAIGFGGYLLLSLVPLKKMAPLVIVTGISALYIGIIMCILWIVQIFSVEYLVLCLLPLNFIIISVKTIRNKVYEWKEINHEEKRIYKYRVLNVINEKLMESWTWPIGGFLLMWPLLGILVCVLALFGQEPDTIIKAWTETSDWNLSNRVAPQNLYFDEHYLCTVAAGGHKNVVKPLRLGMRHGHEVIVNRQLCIANAFEQILEEKLPKTHRRVRSFYDNYGFPIAKLIKSPYVADITYFVMKPLEWFFLIVIYFCDVKPENRIAVQYLPLNSLKNATT